MSRIESDLVIAATGTNTALQLQGKGTGKVSLGDASLLVPDADGAAGQIVTTDGSANLVFAASPGSSGNVLTSNGSGAWTSAAAAGGGAWTLIGTVVASTSATIGITGLDSTYDTYAIVLANIMTDSDMNYFGFRVGDSGGIDSTSGDYGWNLDYVYSSASGSKTYQNSDSDTAGVIRIGTSAGVGSAATEGLSSSFYLNNSATRLITVHGQSSWMNGDGVLARGSFAGYRKSAITLTQVQLDEIGGGNIASGRMTVWGIAHA